jgi:hypothetical protein
MFRRLGAAITVALMLLAITASATLAGEITGNGRKLLNIEDSKWGTGLHARSECAYSGQEDLQWFEDEGTNEVRLENPVKGVPGHAQSWGQIPREVRLFLTSIGSAPGLACNPVK